MTCRAPCWTAVGRHGADFSFSGLKTAVRQLAQDKAINVDDASASFQAAVIDILCDRTRACAWRCFRRDFPGMRHADSGGGRRGRRQSGDRRGA